VECMWLWCLFVVPCGFCWIANWGGSRDSIMK
jgi:hypothetical protein